METVAATHQALPLLHQILHACQERRVRDGQRAVSRPQAAILQYLDENEPITMTALARQVGVTPGTMSLAVGRLARHGHVVRLRDPYDRRRVLVRLSSAGVRVREATAALDQSRVFVALSKLDPAEREQVVGALRVLARAVQLLSAGADTSTDPRAGE